MKKHKIIFWITTTSIFLFEGVMPALTSRSQMSIDGITSLGYPLYFVMMLTVFKVLGSIVLIVPKFPKNVKEWAYAGFGIDFICAFWSLWAVTGFGPMLLIPVIAMILLVLSYTSYHKLQTATAPTNL
jgi:hypothetical protein